MHILHYSLGLAPYRSGGMTTWSMDLMKKQIENGIDVSLMYPSDIKLTSSKISIKKSLSFKGIQVFRLINPLPIPLLYGIDSLDHYYKYNKKNKFTYFFDSSNVDVIHLHTLMGLPIEFLEEAKRRGIKILYTAHDTFGIWPSPDLNGYIINIDSIFNLGYIGSQKVLKYRTIVILQSSIYRLCKDTIFVKKIKNVLKALKSNSASAVTKETSGKAVSVNDDIYVDLRKLYKKYFNLLDTIHFNSELTKKIFATYDIKNNNFVSQVYHSKMQHQPIKHIISKSKSKKKINFLYNGTLEQYKGYNLLLDVLDEIYNEKKDSFGLVVYGKKNPDRPYIDARDSYDIVDIGNVYKDIDVTIVPSLCYETFGMVVAESLSFAVPVIASRNVGAATLLKEGTYGFVFNSRETLKKYLLEIISDHAKIHQQRDAIYKSKDLNFDSVKTYNDVIDNYTSKEVS